MKKFHIHAVSGAVIAMCLGISRRQHSNLVRSGTLPKPDKQKQYDLPKAVRAFVEYRVTDGDRTIAAEKKRVLSETADRLALRNHQSRGDLLLRETVQQVLMMLTVEMVAQFDSIPGRSVAALQGIVDPALQLPVLLSVCRDSRRYLADWLSRAPDAPADFEKLLKDSLAKMPFLMAAAQQGNLR